MTVLLVSENLKAKYYNFYSRPTSIGDLSLKSLCYLGLMCEISSAGLGKLEVVGKARDMVEFNSVPKGHDFSSQG